MICFISENKKLSVPENNIDTGCPLCPPEQSILGGLVVSISRPVKYSGGEVWRGGNEKMPRPDEPRRCLQKGTLPPCSLRVWFSPKKSPVMLKTSQVLTGPNCSLHFIFDIKNPLSILFWTVDHLVHFQGLEPWAR